MVNQTTFFSKKQRVAAWLVHLFTASGAVFGLFTLYAIHHREFLLAFWLMGGAIFIDSIDGVFARRAKTKIVTPNIDGALLDNLIDYVNYVMVPAFFLLIGDLLPICWYFIGSGAIVIASAYQFSQTEAKTEDHFFLGFPSYWNIVVFYLFFWRFSPWINLAIIFILVLLVFIPIKYVYPSRMDYLTPKRWLQGVILFASIMWGVATAGLLWIYPLVNPLFVIISMGYTVLYMAFGFYRTFVPAKENV